MNLTLLGIQEGSFFLEWADFCKFSPTKYKKRTGQNRTKQNTSIQGNEQAIQQRRGWKSPWKFLGKVLTEHEVRVIPLSILLPRTFGLLPRVVLYPNLTFRKLWRLLEGCACSQVHFLGSHCSSHTPTLPASLQPRGEVTAIQDVVSC